MLHLLNISYCGTVHTQLVKYTTYFSTGRDFYSTAQVLDRIKLAFSIGTIRAHCNVCTYVAGTVYGTHIHYNSVCY